ncbi:MAG: branched chain amino acid aminotransferase, partial [Pseudomonadales bacterium]|nr:branched chain amino acid aminotransferase [Pseudomonadales bacterium]
INSLDGRTIGTGRRGAITERLQTAYFDQVRGQRNSFPEWHTQV